MPAKFAFRDCPIEGSDTATMLVSSCSMKDGADTQSNTSIGRYRASASCLGSVMACIGLFQREYQAAYWATPLPNDQFSFFTSTRVIKTSSGRSCNELTMPSA